MKNFVLIIAFVFILGCEPPAAKPEGFKRSLIEGTWELVYGKITLGDSIRIKDISQAKFIKVINETHYAFFNQPYEDPEGYYAGAGTYKLDGTDYTEELTFLKNREWWGEYTFKLEFKGDTLVQHGFEDVPGTDQQRHIVEKYLKIN